MALKDLLGEKFVEGMSIQDIDNALSTMKLADLSKGEYVSIGKFNDEQQKANNFKLELDNIRKANMTAEEKSRAEFEEIKAQLENEKIKTAQYEFEKNILACGYSQAECDLIKANPNDPSVYAQIQAERIKTAVAQANAKSVKETTVIPQSGNADKPKKITEYTMAELNRMQQENPALYKELLKK